MLMFKRGCAVLLVILASACGSSSTTTTSPTPTPTPTPTATTFSLSGTVTDTTTSAVSGATVTIADGVNAGKSTTTSSSGSYSFTALAQSGFTVNVSASNYISTSKSVTLTSNQTLSFQLVRAGPRTTFGTGQYLVGSDIAAGRYYDVPSSGCYWERESGLGGTLGEILSNNFIGFNAGQWIVDIAPSDRAFMTKSGCGTWFKDTPQQGAQTNISPGMWLVGSQVSAGTYRATAQSGCYWERLRDFTGNLSGIIANNFVSAAGSQLVTISAGDTGFDTNDTCGTWTRVSGISTEAIGVSPQQSPADIEWQRTMHRR